MHLSKLVVTSLLLAGCGTSIQATQLNAAPRPMSPRPAASVELFTTARPTQPYVDVALIEAEQSSSYSGHDTPEMLAELRVRAGDMGCDAIIFNGMSSRGPGIGAAERLVNNQPTDRKGVYATCIMYTTPQDGELTAAHQQQADHARCLARRQETFALANRQSDQRARQNILASAPTCPGDVVAR